MKTVIASLFVLMIYVLPCLGQGGESLIAEAGISALAVENNLAAFESPGEYEEQTVCPQTSSYSVRLTTLSGQTISASQAQPSTTYRIVITYTGTYVCCANPAYGTTLAFGFSGGVRDASSGNATITITTDAALPPFGIIGVVGPTDCSGSLASAQNSPSTQKEIP